MKHISYLLITLAVCGLFCPGFSQEKKGQDGKTAIAVLDFVAKGMDEMAITALSDRLRTELYHTGSFTVLERGQMDAVLKEQGFQQSGACTDAACMVEVGQILGVDKMIAGSLGKLGTLYTINLRLIDVGSGKILTTESQDCNCPIEGLFDALHTLAFKLAGKEAPALPTAPAAAAAPAPAAPLPAKTEEVKSGKSHTGLIVGVVVGVAVLGGGAAAYFLLGGNNDTSSTGTGSIDFTW
jgi:TolB-like protein